MIWRRWNWNEILNAKLKMLNADDQKLKANSQRDTKMYVSANIYQ